MNSTSQNPKLWKAPPCPALRIGTIFVTLFFIIIWIIGEYLNDQKMISYGVLYAFVIPIIAFYLSAWRWAKLEKKYAPNQYHYRKIFWGSVAAFIALLVILSSMGNDDTKD